MEGMQVQGGWHSNLFISGSYFSSHLVPLNASNTIPSIWNNIAGIRKDLVKKYIPVEQVLTKKQDPIRNYQHCSLTSDGSFIVKGLRKLWDFNPSIANGKFTWLKEVPIKVICFTWRARMSKIHSAFETNLCSHYGTMQESADRALVRCEYARLVLDCILKWCGVPISNFRTVQDILDYANNQFDYPKKNCYLKYILCLFGAYRNPKMTETST